MNVSCSIKRWTLAAIFLSFTIFCHAQSEWELKKDHEGIRVFTRSVEGSRIKEVKVTCSLNAKLSELAALLMDAAAHERWVYNTRKSYVVRQIDERRQIYYSETSLPWPMGNRDVVIELSISQDPVTKVMEVKSQSVEGVVPEKKGIVRVPMSEVKWVVTPKAEAVIHVEYTGQADPAGSMPSWVANAFIAKGPYETFVKLRQLIKGGDYREAEFRSIAD